MIGVTPFVSLALVFLGGGYVTKCSEVIYMGAGCATWAIALLICKV